MNYLIFGGSGFIGIHLANLIKQKDAGASIYNLDIVKNDHGGKSKYIKCDVREEINLNIPLTGNDIIFNLAAIHRTPGHPDYDYFDTNIKGAENICTFAENNNITKILFTSSIAPYGAAELHKKESTLPTPNTPYGISKLVAEKIHQIWQGKDSNRELLILRPGVVFGKGENGNFTRLASSIKKNLFFFPGRKDTVKASIYVKDLVYFGLEKMTSDKIEGVELYNCTYEPAFTIEQIAENIADVMNCKRPKLLINGNILKFAASIIAFFGGGRLGVHPDRVKKVMISTNINGEKLANSGYRFKYTFREALIDWYADNENQCLK